MSVEKTYQHCVKQLKEFVEDAGFSEVVVGLSGGIDSALVATMAVDALGASQMHGVLMPGPHSSDHSVADAQELADTLDIDTSCVSINEPYNAFDNVLDEACGGPLQGLAAENVQARCRMICLMALSNTFGWMVLNTGNRSESYVGYSTLYGDMIGAFAPLGGLYKTQVYELARWRNKHTDAFEVQSPIPTRTLEKPPSAELAPNQEDAQSLGLGYDAIDDILQGYLDQGFSYDDLIAQGNNPKDVEQVLAYIDASKFKRSYEPPHP